MQTQCTGYVLQRALVLGLVYIGGYVLENNIILSLLIKNVSLDAQLYCHNIIMIILIIIMTIPLPYCLTASPKMLVATNGRVTTSILNITG